MRGGKAERIEAIVDRGAAAAFAAAMAFAVWKLSAPTGLPWGLAVGAGAIAYMGSAALLSAVRPREPRFTVADFAIAGLCPAENDELLLTEEAELLLTEQAELLLTEQVELLLTEQVELVLTDADRVQPVKAEAPDALVLDDILAELGPGSRVVRLFDPAAMPTPAQLNARIKRHLSEEPAPAATSDDSQALYAALANLRASLR